MTGADLIAVRPVMTCWGWDGAEQCYRIPSGCIDPTTGLFMYVEGQTTLQAKRLDDGTLLGADLSAGQRERTLLVVPVPRPGAHFESWDDGIAERARRFLAADLASIPAQPVFRPGDPQVRFLAGAGGDIEGQAVQSVPHGSPTEAVAAVPNEGFHFARWSDGNVQNPRRLQHITADREVTALFEPNIYTLEFKAGNYGHLEGKVVQLVEHGGTASPVTAVAEKGYVFESWSDNSRENPRICTSVSGDMTLTAIFAPGMLYITVDVSGGPDATHYPVRSSMSFPDPMPSVYKTSKIALRRIPSGHFVMGSPEHELGHVATEGQHQVTLTRDFYIGVYEITQQQWQLVTGMAPSYFDSTYPDFSYGELDAQRPVEHVSYGDIRGTGLGRKWPKNDQVDASSFVGRLRSKTGLHFDLPTEAQWEYACRAGRITALNNGSNLTMETGHCMHLDLLGWFDHNACYVDWTAPHASVSGTQPVGRKVPNGWQLYDMHGNVREWCLDWYWYDLGSEAVVDPLGRSTPDAYKQRVVRGGNWYSSARFCRSACRSHTGDTTRNPYHGLRICCAPPDVPTVAVQWLRISPKMSTLAPGETQAYEIVATFTDQSIADVSNSALLVALPADRTTIIGAAVTVHPDATPGDITINATYCDESASAVLNVKTP